jgi:hypothetical protein
MSKEKEITPEALYNKLARSMPDFSEKGFNKENILFLMKEYHYGKSLKKPTLFDRLFNRWTKWELSEENLEYTQVTYESPLYGTAEIGRGKVLVDVYVKENKFTGLKKYKRVKKR